jgi:hypothetical protein
MKSSQPPPLATWLLEHLVPESKNEVLAGDLLEGFGQHGSATWYWRQVLAAIMVSFLQELRVRSTAILFSVVCSSLVPWRHIWNTPQFKSLSHFGSGLPWPLSLISQIALFTLFDAVMLVFVFGVYLAVRGSFNLHRFSQALLVALPVLALASTGIMFSTASPLPLFVKVDLAARLPLFLGLLTSIWIVAPSAACVDSKSPHCLSTPD